MGKLTVKFNGEVIGEALTSEEAKKLAKTTLKNHLKAGVVEVFKDAKRVAKCYSDEIKYDLR
jgi:hypothetical protein